MKHQYDYGEVSVAHWVPSGMQITPMNMNKSHSGLFVSANNILAVFPSCLIPSNALWGFIPTSPYLTLPHLTSPQLTLPYLTSPHLTSPHFTSPHLTSPYLTLPHLTLPHLTSPHLTSPHLISPHLTLTSPYLSRCTDCDQFSEDLQP